MITTMVIIGVITIITATIIGRIGIITVTGTIDPIIIITTTIRDGIPLV